MIAERPPLGDEESPLGSEPKRSEWDQKEMSFTEHLRELRNRLVICLATVGVFAAVLFWPAQYVIPWMTHLYFPTTRLHAFGPADVILTEFKFSIYGALVLGLPVILFQIWMFIVPVFHPKTRRMVYAYVAPSLLLGVAGIAFAHFLVLPRVTGALLTITNQVAETTFGIEPTMNLILVMLAAFALVFQTPVIMVLLARIGVINVPMLRKYRRYALMGILVVSGVLAPDASPMTMMLLAVPMALLYEVSILVIAVLQKSWKREAAGT
ncbi:MAG: twin-arginine translocase subunit TatC [Candidatus Velthaea sp.]